MMFEGEDRQTLQTLINIGTSTSTDYFSHECRDYLLICDLFSKYPCLYKVKSKSGLSLSQMLQELITQYRPPNTIYTNNGPPLAPNEFEQFLQFQHITHITFSPHFPQSNGFIKHQVKTLKTALSTSQDVVTPQEDLFLNQHKDTFT